MTPEKTPDTVILWPSTALRAAKHIKNSNPDQTMIKCFHDYPTVQELSTFIFPSSMEGFKDSTAGNTVLHEASSHSLEELGRLRVMLCQAMGHSNWSGLVGEKKKRKKNM